MPVREGLLSLLADEPRVGYQLKTAFEAATGGVWTLNVGQVYTTLDRLGRDGLVRVELIDAEGGDGEQQKLYVITDDGREALGAWWDAVPVDEPPPRDELMLKVLTAIEHSPAHALDVVTRQRTALIGLLRQRRQERSGLEGEAAGVSAELVTDALVLRAEADLRWLDRCEARLLELDRSNTSPGGAS